MMLVELPRMVQLWSYTASHSQLLLRATKDRDHATRVDVLFKGVGAMQLPSVMAALTVREAEPDERQAILSSTSVDMPDERRCFVLEGPDFRGWVVAGAMVSTEDEGEYFEPSPLLDRLVGGSGGPAD
ncbi:MAG: hypothetical protein KDB10_00990 [Acidimicrobiales bacterium]|nr:hypothetical protein [Acidimicrobiales bacterium]MCB9373084.1 hypothetical protein [Microthrixaceae bacterium]